MRNVRIGGMSTAIFTNIRLVTYISNNNKYFILLLRQISTIDKLVGNWDKLKILELTS